MLEDRERYGPSAWLLQPSYWAVAVYRLGQWSKVAPRPIRPAIHGAYFALYSVVRLITGIDLPRSAQIGTGLMIHHFGGIFVNPGARIGNRCTLRQGVTIGNRHENGGSPTLGDFVDVGAYAQILGDIHVGDHATIGAMSVVLVNVPAGATVVGNPARIVRLRDWRHAEELAPRSLHEG